MIKIDKLKNIFLTEFRGENSKSAEYFFDEYFSYDNYFEYIEDNIIKSICFNVHWIEINIRGIKYQVPLINGLYTLLSYRWQGNMRKILKTIEEIAIRKDSPLIFISPSFHKYVKKEYDNHFHLNNYQFLGMVNYDENVMNHHEIDINANKLHEIYKKYSKIFDVYKERTINDFKRLIKEAKIYNYQIYATENSYVIYQPKDQVIEEIAYSNLVDILYLILKINPQIIKLTNFQKEKLNSAKYQLDLRFQNEEKSMLIKILNPEIIDGVIFERENIFIKERF